MSLMWCLKSSHVIKQTLFAIPWFAETVRDGDLEFQRNLYLGLTSALTIVVISLWYLWTTYRGAERAPLVSISEKADTESVGNSQNSTGDGVSTQEKTRGGLHLRLLRRYRLRKGHQLEARAEGDAEAAML
jgi:hypothetical protein